MNTPAPTPAGRTLLPLSKPSHPRHCCWPSLRTLLLLTVGVFMFLVATLAPQRVVVRAQDVLRNVTLRPHQVFARTFNPSRIQPLSRAIAPALALYSRTVSSTRSYFTSPNLRSPSEQHQQFTMATATGKFAKPPQAPPLFNHNKDNLYKRFEELARETKDLNDAIVADVKPGDATWENAWLKSVMLEQEQTNDAYIIDFYQSVSPDKELRDEAVRGSEMLEKASIEESMRLDVYERFVNIYKNRESFDLDPEAKRILDKDHKGFVKMGLGLPEGEKRDRFKAIKERMTELVTQFTKTLNEEDGGLWLTPEELDGLPADDLERLAKGTGENEGKKRLTFKYPDVIPAMKFVKDGTVRRKIGLADSNKCNSNAPIFKELVVLRDEAARILGYPNHATMRLDERMAKDPITVKTFLEDLRDRLKPAGKDQVAQLHEIKKADLKERGLPEEPEFYTWDWRYYERIMVEKEYMVEENKIAEYFPLNSTVTGMLGIFEKLFGLRFFELSEGDKAAISPTGKASDITWHKDVVMFSVFDDEANGDGFIGYFYMDMHPRPGKYTHAANFGIQPGWTQKDGTRHYPCTSLVCNFSPPTDKKPSLLKHDEVTTLFHELGHGIHDLVGKTRYTRFHGTNTARDFVEAPSQMLENWCWTPGVLKTLSKHWSTGEPIPDDLVAKLVKTYRLHEALLTLRQLQFGFYDMAVHTPESHEAIKSLETGPLYNEMRASLVPMKGEEAFGKGFDFSHGEATFGHLVGGYDSGYYGYLYSQVYSADMWDAAFKSDPMNGVMGRKYRTIVLQRGGSRDEMENLEEFLGRKPSSEAFYRELGIAK